MTDLVMVQMPVMMILEEQPLDANPALVYLSRLSEGSRHTMHQALDTIADMLMTGTDAFIFPWSELRYPHTTAIRAKLAESHAPATANKMLSALRGVLEQVWRLGQVDAESYRQAVSIECVKGARLPSGRAIAPGELQALMRACATDPGATGIRDATIMGLLYSCGLRVGELCSLDLADYDPETGELVIRRAKGGKQRLAHVVNGAHDALADWLALRGDVPGALFYPSRKGNHIHPGRLTQQAVYEMLRTRAKQADVRPLSPHDFRRTFVGDLLDAGADLATVQALAGHASPVTTARYDRRPEAARRKAVELLHVPYTGRVEC